MSTKTRTQLANELHAAALDYLGSSGDIYAGAKWHALNDAVAAYGVAKSAPSAKAADKEPSAEGWAFAKWSAEMVITIRVNSAHLRKWAFTYDAMIRLDKRTKEQICAVWRFARSDASGGFYRKNILSPVKLRQPDKQGVMWFDRIAEAMRGATPAVPQGTVKIVR